MGPLEPFIAAGAGGRPPSPSLSCRFGPLRIAASLALAGVIVLTGAGAGAQEETRTERELKAHRHFQRAVEFADDAQYAEALVELKRAHAAAPSYAVLYNIGMVWVALGHPIEAIAALEAYLEQGGAAIPDQRRTEVVAELRRQRGRVGAVTVELEPPDATLLVDGVPATLGSGGVVQLGAGLHQLTALQPNHTPATAPVAIRGGETLTVRLALESAPAGGAAEPAAANGWGFVDVRCVVPDVTVTIDGRVAGATPLRSPLALPVGAHRLEFRRVGYVGSAREVQVVSARVEPLDCAVTPEAPLSSEQGGELVVRANVRRPTVLIDGAPAVGRVPVGRHEITVRRWGYEDWSQEAEIRAGARTELTADLEPTPEAIDAARARMRNLQIVSGILAAGALGLGVGAWGSLAAGEREHERWTERQRELDPLVFSGQGDAALAEEQRENDRRLQRRMDLEQLGTGLAVASGACLVSAAGLFLGSTLGVDAPRRSVSVGAASLVYRQRF